MDEVIRRLEIRTDITRLTAKEDVETLLEYGLSGPRVLEALTIKYQSSDEPTVFNVPGVNLARGALPTQAGFYSAAEVANADASDIKDADIRSSAYAQAIREAAQILLGDHKEFDEIRRNHNLTEDELLNLINRSVSVGKILSGFAETYAEVLLMEPSFIDQYHYPPPSNFATPGGIRLPQDPPERITCGIKRRQLDRGRHSRVDRQCGSNDFWDRWNRQ
jgi:hypothetical protein